MSAATALNIRRLGLIIEVLCIVGILSIARRNAPEPELVFGVPLFRVFQVGLGCGLVIWCIGTAAYRRARQRGEE